eukprot:954269_1
MPLLLHAVNHAFLLNVVVSGLIHMVADVTIVAELIVMAVATMLLMELTELVLLVNANANAEEFVEIIVGVRDRRMDVLLNVTSYVCFARNISISAKLLREGQCRSYWMSVHRSCMSTPIHFRKLHHKKRVHQMIEERKREAFSKIRVWKRYRSDVIILHGIYQLM